jgi:hypothetical protein
VFLNSSWMRAVVRVVAGKAEEEPIAELRATTTTPPAAALGADPRREEFRNTL